MAEQEKGFERPLRKHAGGTGHPQKQTAFVGEEEQGSEVTLWPTARAEQSELCDDEGRGKIHGLMNAPVWVWA